MGRIEVRNKNCDYVNVLDLRFLAILIPLHMGKWSVLAAMLGAGVGSYDGKRHFVIANYLRSPKIKQEKN